MVTSYIETAFYVQQVLEGKIKGADRSDKKARKKA